MNNIVLSKKTFVFILAVLLLVILFLLAGYFKVFQVKPQPRYAAVYLTSGDIYFGKVSYFPRLKLTDTWFLRRIETGEWNLEKLKDVVWKPKEPLYLNRKNIVFIVGLQNDSPVIKAIQEQTTNN